MWNQVESPIRESDVPGDHIAVDGVRRDGIARAGGGSDELGALGNDGGDGIVGRRSAAIVDVADVGHKGIPDRHLLRSLDLDSHIHRSNLGLAKERELAQVVDGEGQGVGQHLHRLAKFAPGLLHSLARPHTQGFTLEARYIGVRKAQRHCERGLELTHGLAKAVGVDCESAVGIGQAAGWVMAGASGGNGSTSKRVVSVTAPAGTSSTTP